MKGVVENGVAQRMVSAVCALLDAGTRRLATTWMLFSLMFVSALPQVHHDNLNAPWEVRFVRPGQGAGSQIELSRSWREIYQSVLGSDPLRFLCICKDDRREVGNPEECPDCVVCVIPGGRRSVYAGVHCAEWDGGASDCSSDPDNPYPNGQRYQVNMHSPEVWKQVEPHLKEWLKNRR